MRSHFLRLFAASALLSCPLYADPQPEMIHVRVTVQNGTAGNAIAPFVVALHDASKTLFEVGTPASAGLARLAETGDTSGLEQELDAQALRHYKAPGSPLLPGETRSVDFMLPASDKGQTRLSLAAMIGRSNDSFVSLRGFDLNHLQTRVTLPATNFDAGSEENSGNVADFGPGGHPTAQAEGRISYDRGLNPRGDAPESWAWGSVAAVVTIEVL